ncbi:MAG: nucleoside triphosphate pyrophosphohydrolase [Candidatus Obscuribacterales bacterium]|nr:nucleoside triphosphate pyrophosphohydrolase [Candidatus Obscuribacterales bacterium]
MSSIQEFIRTIARLRAPDGCPWDKEQDHKSLARYLLEESYEVLEAIHQEEPAKLKEELGDLLLQIVLHAQIASEKGDYDMEAIAAGINAKMISRHPHVFGEKKLDSAGAVVTQWEELKKQEAKNNGEQGSIIDSVPRALPALLKSLKVSEKAVSQGFEWRDFDELWQKVMSEIEELKEALAMEPGPERQKEVELDLGDVLFCMVNVARWNKLNPEESLLVAIDKFRQRYKKMEELSERPLNELSKDELAQYWQKAKAEFSQKS